MGSVYEMDIFLSFASEQQAEVASVVEDIRKAGLTVWWAKDIDSGDPFPKKIDRAIEKSRHLLLYCTPHSKGSEWVTREVKKFQQVSKGDPSRKLFVLMGPGGSQKYIPKTLGDIHYANSPNEVIVPILRDARSELENELRRLEVQAEEEKRVLQEGLDLKQRKVREAREYYRHRRFWGPFAENRDLHIFTCGRDIPPDPTRPRGTHGWRTNIDKWDYRAVLDITHFFAAHYPSTRLTIEDPASKLQRGDIQQTHVLANRIAEVGSLLENKDCIIIGSPDVNDFAEIVLSKIHKIDAYDDARKKSKGFVLLRNGKNAPSAFYWSTQADEKEGIARLGEKNLIHAHETPLDTASAQKIGKMHGLLVVAENPFRRSGTKKRIMILSGFSGVATNAMTKFLTEDAYLPAFFEFDEAYSQQGSAIEALIGVQYIADSSSENKDARQILPEPSAISFEGLVVV